MNITKAVFPYFQGAIVAIKTIHKTNITVNKNTLMEIKRVRVLRILVVEIKLLQQVWISRLQCIIQLYQ